MAMENNIETRGLGAGSYPEPTDVKTKTAHAKLYLNCNIETTFLQNTTYEEMERYLKTNWRYLLEDYDDINLDFLEIVKVVDDD